MASRVFLLLLAAASACSSGSPAGPSGGGGTVEGSGGTGAGGVTTPIGGAPSNTPGENPPATNLGTQNGGGGNASSAGAPSGMGGTSVGETMPGPLDPGPDPVDTGTGDPGTVDPGTVDPDTVDPGTTGTPVTAGGRGGTVIKVTTLASNGAGSLAAALAVSGPRIIVFEVGGVIDLNRARLDVTSPFVTIAGQTAPAPGISIVRGGMRVLTHDVVVQHVRVRMGDAGAAPASGFEPDVTTDGAEAYNVLFDHVSVAWGVDENLSVSGPRFDGAQATSRRVTIQNSIIAEGLMNSVHEKGAHSMGSLIHDYCTDVAVIGNLYAYNNERNPWFKGFATGVIVNNVVYDPGRWAMRLGPVDGEWTEVGVTPEGPRVSVVGNYLRQGVDTPAGLTMVGSNSRGSAYLEDNLAFNAAGAPIAIADAVVSVLAQPPTWVEGLVARPSAEVFEQVLAHAGARPKERDAVDQRIVSQVRAATGSIIDSQDEVGGYPAPPPTRRTLDVPSSGIDEWLAGMARALE